MKKFVVMLLALASFSAMAQPVSADGQAPACACPGAKKCHAKLSEDPVIRSFQRVVPGYQPATVSEDPVIRSFQMVIPGYQP